MLFIDFPPQMQQNIVCSISAAMKYAIPANIVLAIAEKEGGKPGLWVRNSNGSFDVGLMQFNTAYLGDLAGYGITPDDVAKADCYSFELAAWRLRGHIRSDKGDLWTRAANYHSRTPVYNAKYRADLMVKAAKWADWLDARFVTHDFTRPQMVHHDVATALQPNHVMQNQVSTDEEKDELVTAQATTQLSSTRNTGYVPRRLIVSTE